MVAKPFSRTLVPALFVVATAGCSGGGSTDSALGQGVNLSGDWAFTYLVTNVQGTCSGTVVGQQLTVQGSVVQDSGSLSLTIDTQTFAGTLTGTTANLTASETNGATTVVIDLVLQFTANGEICTGTARSTTSESGAVVCVADANITAVRSAATALLDDPTWSPVAAEHGSVRWNDGESAPGSKGPTVAATLCEGEAGTHWLALTFSTAIDSVVIRRPEQPGHWSITFVTPRKSVLVGLSWPEFTHGDQVFVRGESAGSSGAEIELILP